MTDQTGAEQQSASGSQTGDVDVADPSRPDTTTAVQTGGATDVGAGGPDTVTAEDDAAIRGGQDVDGPRSERDVTDRERDAANRERGDTADERGETSREGSQDSDEGARDSDESAPKSDEERQPSDEERQKTAEEFAREHDPEQHDVAAGDEFRQEGDWTADDAGGPQVWDSEGSLIEGSAPGRTESDSGPSESSSTGSQEDRSGDAADGGRRTSSLDEIRDGGYGVGSAATIDDGAVPLGHPVKAWEDTKTYVTPDHAKYGEAEPHLWFADAHAAQRAGFRPVD
jgi:hypothetical protein